jgi:hypothetical protein
MNIRITAADQERIQDDDVHDTPLVAKQSLVLCHGMSPELMAGGPRFVAGAAIGDFVATLGDTKKAFKNGVFFHPIAFTLTHPEYTVGVGDGDRGEYVTDHGVDAPADMDFIKVTGGVSRKRGAYPAGLVAKNGHYRIVDGKPGNKVVPTITAYGLVEGHGVGYAMYGTAWAVGLDWVGRAERLRVRAEAPDGKPEELKGCTLGVFKLTSRSEKKGAFPYPVPVVTLVGKLGEPGGPSVERWRFAGGLRQAFKQSGGLDWVPDEALDPPAPPPDPALQISAAQAGARAAALKRTGSTSTLSEINPPLHEGDGFDDGDPIPF